MLVNKLFNFISFWIACDSLCDVNLISLYLPDQFSSSISIKMFHLKIHSEFIVIILRPIFVLLLFWEFYLFKIENNLSVPIIILIRYKCIWRAQGIFFFSHLMLQNVISPTRIFKAFPFPHHNFVLHYNIPITNDRWKYYMDMDGMWCEMVKYIIHYTNRHPSHGLWILFVFKSFPLILSVPHTLDTCFVCCVYLNHVYNPWKCLE